MIAGNDLIVKYQEFSNDFKKYQKLFRNVHPPYIIKTVDIYENILVNLHKKFIDFIRISNSSTHDSKCCYNKQNEIFGYLMKQYEEFTEFVVDIFDSYNKEDKIYFSNKDAYIKSKMVTFNEFDDTKKLKIEKQMYKLKDDHIIFERDFRKHKRKITRILRKETVFLKRQKLEKKRLRKHSKKIQSTCEEHQVDLDNESLADNNCLNPEAMMKSIFNDYMTNGQWSWHNWLDTMKNIRQINPKWAEVFSENCKNLGINWDGILQDNICKIAENNTHINIRFDKVDDGNSVDSITGSIFETNQPLFNIEQEQQEQPIDNTNPLFCDVCQIEYSSKHKYNVHLRGVKHVQLQLNHIRQEEIKRIALIDDVKATETTSVLTKHPTNNSSPLDHVQVKSSIESVINQTSNALLGLQFISEYQIADKLEHSRVGTSLATIKYACALCCEFIIRSQIILHIVGNKHRLNYFKQVHPHLYEIIRHNRKDKLYNDRKLEQCCKELERHEGRQKLRVMIQLDKYNSICGTKESLSVDKYLDDDEDGEINSEDDEEDAPTTEQVPRIKSISEKIREAGELSSEDEASEDDLMCSEQQRREYNCQLNALGRFELWSNQGNDESSINSVGQFTRRSSVLERTQLQMAIQQVFTGPPPVVTNPSPIVKPARPSDSTYQRYLRFLGGEAKEPTISVSPPASAAPSPGNTTSSYVPLVMPVCRGMIEHASTSLFPSLNYPTNYPTNYYYYPQPQPYPNHLYPQVNQYNR